MSACEEVRTGYLTRTAGQPLRNVGGSGVTKHREAQCYMLKKRTKNYLGVKRVCLGFKSRGSNFNSQKPGSSLGK